MLHKISLTFAALFLCAGLYSQTLIPRVGLTVSRINYDFDGEYLDDLKLKSRVGFVVGVGYEFILFRNISLLPEVTFVQKGFKAEEESYEDPYAHTTKSNLDMVVNYLEIPVIAKIKFGKGVTKFYLTAGPSIAYGLGGKLKASQSDSYENNPDWDTSIKKDYKVKFGDVPENYQGTLFEILNNKVEVGAQLGAGAELFGKVIVDVRYSMGLSKLYDGSGNTYFDQGKDAKNRVIQFSVGMPIRIFKGI